MRSFRAHPQPFPKGREANEIKMKKNLTNKFKVLPFGEDLGGALC